MKTIQQQRAETKANYDYDPGDSAALLLAIMGEEHDQNRKQLETIVCQLRQNVQALQTDKPTAAFWYGVGKGLNWGVPLLIAVCLVGWFYNQSETYQKILTTIESYPDAEKFSFLMKETSVKTDENGMSFIELNVLPKDQVITVGQHYIFRKDCNCVQVPLLFNQGTN